MGQFQIPNFNSGRISPTPVKKPKMLLVMGGFLAIVGIGLLFYEPLSIVGNLNTQEKHLGIRTSMELTNDLDPSINDNAGYVLQIMDFKNGNRLETSVYDPSGQIIASKSIDYSPFEDSFKISANGMYKLKIENNGERELEVVAAIGYLPHDKSLLVSKFGFIVTIIGLIGLAVGIVSFIKSRSGVDTN